MKWTGMFYWELKHLKNHNNHYIQEPSSILILCENVCNKSCHFEKSHNSHLFLYVLAPSICIKAFFLISIM